MRFSIFVLLMTIGGFSLSAKENRSDWIPLFNGKDLDGWRASEHPETFRVDEGVIVAQGDRSHLFYVGEVGDASFDDFELRCEVLLEPGANSGLFFHTEYQDEGSPGLGYEVQLNNTHTDRRRTGGLFAIADVMDDSPAEDNTWFTQQVTVVGNRIIVRVNGLVTTDYTEPEGAATDSDRRPGRLLSEGTIALQGHDPASVARFRKVEVRLLEEGTAPAAVTPVPVDAPWWRERHAAKLAEKEDRKEPIELVFLGDSITHAWERPFGRAVWEERFVPRGALCLGYSGDRTEHVLWRLGLGDAGEANNEIGGLSPKLFVLMIGTNNTGQRQDPAEETAAGIRAIVDRLQELSPESELLLLAVFPRGATPDDPLRRLNDAINSRIAPLGERERVTFLDLKAIFLDEQGNLPQEIMPDRLHPEGEGYQRWADALEPYVARFLGE